MKNLNNKLTIAASLLALTLTSTVSQAAFITYSDKAAFLAASGSPDAIMTYDDAVADGAISNVSSYSENGLSISHLQHIIDDTWGDGRYGIGSDAIAQSSEGQVSTVSYTSSFFSAGFDLFTVMPDGNHARTMVDIGLSSGESFTVNTAGLVNGESLFVGFISDTAISSFSLSAISGTGDDRRWINTDNVMVAMSSTSAAPVPEPTAVTLMALSLLLLGFVRRKS